ncbi:MAG: DUF3147 family protein [Salinivirgaceae bacterium]|jgi:uncharacterized membrane protein YfcA|nr:DUF3147 family protein [Salinivirgaceae bacterium]
MDEIVWQVFQSFVIAGIWIALATFIAEKLGSRIGGAIANLPSTILVSLVYVSIVRSPQYAAEAALAAPMGMAINTVFLFVFVLLMKRPLWIATLASLTVWCCLAFVASHFPDTGIVPLVVLYLSVMIVSFLLLEHVFKVPSAEKRAIPFRWWTIFMRALFAGSVVGSTVVISSFANSFWTGIFATFPAVMLSSMLILRLAQGPDFARAVGKTMVLASVNIIVFAGAVHFLYPLWGVLWGTVVAFLLATLFVVFIRPYLMRMK